MSILKAYLHYLQDPAEALKKMLQERSVASGCFGFFVATLGWVLFFNVGDGLSVPVLLLKLAIVFLAELTAGYFLAALASLFLDLTGVKNSSVELFILIGSSGLIKSLLIAFAIISNAVPAAQLHYIAPFALLVVYILQVIYLTKALMRVYEISCIKALCAWLCLVIPVFILGLLVSVFGIWGIILLF